MTLKELSQQKPRPGTHAFPDGVLFLHLKGMAEPLQHGGAPHCSRRLPDFHDTHSFQLPVFLGAGGDPDFGAAAGAAPDGHLSGFGHLGILPVGHRPGDAAVGAVGGCFQLYALSPLQAHRFSVHLHLGADFSEVHRNRGILRGLQLDALSLLCGRYRLLEALLFAVTADAVGVDVGSLLRSDFYRDGLPVQNAGGAGDRAGALAALLHFEGSVRTFNRDALERLIGDIVIVRHVFRIEPVSG